MPSAQDTHERLTGGAPARASDRAFGAAFAALFAVIGAIARLASAQTLSAWLFVISGAALAVALLTPGLLSPLNALRARMMDSTATPPPHYAFRRIFVIIWWNTLTLAAGLLLVGFTAEAWFRLNTPFAESRLPTVFVPGVGLLRPTETEVRITNGLDFWTISKTNSLGFLERETEIAAIAAPACRVTIIGDSFVEGKRVAIEEKLQVRFESLASFELPELNVVAAAFGFGGVGQINQLAYYDHYARRLRPNMVALVFTMNDFAENHPAMLGAFRGIDPSRLPFVSAEKNEDGTWRLTPPNARFSPLPAPQKEPSLRMRVRNFAMKNSYFVRWFFTKRDVLTPNEKEENFVAWSEAISRLPGYESFLEGWEPTTRQDAHLAFNQEELPPAFQEAIEITAFALDEFVDRTKRDGAQLVILASHTMGPSGDPLFERLADMARERGIPVINQYDYIARQGGKIEDARFAHDIHWNAQGHQWAAEALLEWLRDNPHVCADADAA